MISISHRCRLLIAALLAAAWGCGDPALTVELIGPNEISGAYENPFENVDSLLFQIFHAENKQLYKEITVKKSADEADFSDLPKDGTPLRIRVTALNKSGAIQSWGQSATFTLEDGATKTLNILVSRVNTWSPVVSLTDSTAVPVTLAKARAGHTASLLADGRVLFVGGFQKVSSHQAGTASDFVDAPSVEVLDPASGMLVYTASDARLKRAFHSAVTLGDGQVLVSGGESEEGVLSSNLLLSTAADGSVSPAPLKALSGGRTRHTASLNALGNVLLYGGLQGESPDFAPGYDWLSVPNTSREGDGSAQRVGHAQVTAAGNRIFVIGGQTSAGALASGGASVAAFIDGNEIAAVPRISPRLFPAVAPLGTSKKQVLIAGGFGDVAAKSALNTVQLVSDLDNNDVIDETSLSVARGLSCAVTLKDGSVLIVGGHTGRDASASCDLYDADGRRVANQEMTASRYFHSCTLLEDGRVLVAGGMGSGGKALNALEVFVPNPVEEAAWSNPD